MHGTKSGVMDGYAVGEPAHRRPATRSPHDRSWPAARRGPLRPEERARCLRRRLHRQPEEPQLAHDRRERPRASSRTSSIAAPSAPTRMVGDGAGMLVQIPHRFFAAEARAARLRAAGARRTTPSAYIFMPQDRKAARGDGRRRREGASPTRARRSSAGATSRSTIPACPAPEHHADRAVPPPGLHRPRRRHSPTRTPSSGSSTSSARSFRAAYLRPTAGCTTTSTSSRCRAGPSSTRACSSPTQLGAYYRDLHDPRVRVGAGAGPPALLDQHLPVLAARPPLPHRRHNGEINTVRGNVNWMAARQASVSSPLFGDDISKLWPISYEGQSDTACFDNALEFLMPRRLFAAACGDDADPRGLGGQPAHGRGPARLLRVPRRADGAVGRPGGHGLLRRPSMIGATLDRNGLRPARYMVTADDEVIMASEDGVLPVPRREDRREVAAAAGQDAAHRSRARAASSPTTRSRRELARQHPYQDWLERTQIVLETCRPSGARGRRERRAACSIASRPSATPRKT